MVMKQIVICLFLLSSCARLCTEFKPTEKTHKEDKNARRLFRESLFYDLMGKTEDGFLKDAKHYGGIGSLDLTQYKTQGHNARAVDKVQSHFEMLTIKTLEAEWKNHKKKYAPADAPGSITLLDGYAIRDDEGLMAALEQTDIRYLQEAYPRGVFQIASNFNCLEGGVGTGTLTDMIKMSVQGENAVLATLGGGLIRKYLIAHDLRNLLGTTSVKDYVDSDGVVTQPITFKGGDLGNIAVGYHKDVVVTSGYYPPFVRAKAQFSDTFGVHTLEKQGGVFKDKKNKEVVLVDGDKNKGVIDSNRDAFLKYTPEDSLLDRIAYLFKNNLVDNDRVAIFVFDKVPKQSGIEIDQVFTAALNVCAGKPNHGNNDVAQVILKQMYAGTILSAALNNKPEQNRKIKVFLTMVGTGAFCNEPAWVMEALDQPIVKEVIRYTGMEVYLVIYPDVRDDRGLDTKAYDEQIENKKDQKAQKGSALPFIRQAAEKINRDIQGSGAVERLARAFKGVK